VFLLLLFSYKLWFSLVPKAAHIFALRSPREVIYNFFFVSKREYLHNSKSVINEHKDWKIIQDIQISYFQNRPMSYVSLELVTTFHFVPSGH
jgi:lysyl-tRNA synthetase class I